MEYTVSNVITVKIGPPIKTKSMCLQRLVHYYVVGILGVKDFVTQLPLNR